jgi:hypothetical protein
MFQRSFGSIPDLVVELIGHLRAEDESRLEVAIRTTSALALALTQSRRGGR